MKKVNFKKHPVNLKGALPQTGMPAPSFSPVPVGVQILVEVPQKYLFRTLKNQMKELIY